MRQAATDALTGLATRRHFYDCLDRGILEAERDGCSVAMPRIRVDGGRDLATRVDAAKRSGGDSVGGTQAS